MSRTERDVLDALTEDGPLATVDLAAAIDEHPLTVDHVCTRLHEAGYLRLIGGQRYEVTASGRRQRTDETLLTGDADGRAGAESRP